MLFEGESLVVRLIAGHVLVHEVPDSLVLLTPVQGVIRVGFILGTITGDALDENVVNEVVLLDVAHQVGPEISKVLTLCLYLSEAGSFLEAEVVQAVEVLDESLAKPLLG